MDDAIGFQIRKAFQSLLGHVPPELHLKNSSKYI